MASLYIKIDGLSCTHQNPAVNKCIDLHSACILWALLAHSLKSLYSALFQDLVCSFTSFSFSNIAMHWISIIWKPTTDAVLLLIWLPSSEYPIKFNSLIIVLVYSTSMIITCIVLIECETRVFSRRTQSLKVCVMLFEDNRSRISD